jgi:hypothetical protein
VTNVIPLGCPLPLIVTTVTSIQTLKGPTSFARRAHVAADVGGLPAPAPLLGHAAADGFMYTYSLQPDYSLLREAGIDCRASPDDVGTVLFPL